MLRGIPPPQQRTPLQWVRVGARRAEFWLHAVLAVSPNLSRARLIDVGGILHQQRTPLLQPTVRGWTHERVALARGEQLPEGWVVDADGNPSTDPEAYTSKSGALVPFGGPVGHKGYALAFVLDVLAGALSPAGCSRVHSEQTGNALFVQAIRIEAFRPLEAFKSEVGRFIDHVKSAPPAPGFEEVFVPGERSHLTRQKRLAEGIPVEDATWNRIRKLAEELGVGV